LSGMRPTGKLHLGHLVGALDNWVKLQEEYDCCFMVADWHALMSEYEYPAGMSESMVDNVIDWLSVGIDPAKSVIFVQSKVSAHMELYMILSCLTPLGWLERCPTYKEQLREVATRDLHTYAFLGYPVLQAADILLYKASKVPVGEDQLPHLELTREIARRFNGLYKTDLFPEPEAILTPTPRLLGLDGRKMSKSYNNTINLSDNAETIVKKVNTMITDPARVKRSDKGHPEVCNVHAYYEVFFPDKKIEVEEGCCSASLGCTDCKKMLAAELVKKLSPFACAREAYLRDKNKITDILNEGAKKATALASLTIEGAREAMKL
jgi:tryptophanyl-tRNA synthetase